MRILVADGQRLFAEALAIALRTYEHVEPIDVYPVHGLAALKATHDHRPDIVLLDYWIPGMAAATVTRAINIRMPDTKVLLLSWLHGPSQVGDGFSAGAVGFLPKSVSCDEVIEAIELAHAGETLVYGPELARLMESIEERADVAQEELERLLALSVREMEILQLLSRGAAPKDIAKRLSISVGTVKNHIHNILTKTGAGTRAEVIAMAMRARLIADLGPPTRRAGPQQGTS